MCVRYLLVPSVSCMFVIKHGHLAIKSGGGNVHYEFCGIILFREFRIYQRGSTTDVRRILHN